ncbi:hypothetical protein JCM31598_00570 [Desulfonatronum parangueonense]
MPDLIELLIQKHSLDHRGGRLCDAKSQTIRDLYPITTNEHTVGVIFSFDRMPSFSGRTDFSPYKRPLIRMINSKYTGQPSMALLRPD